MKIISSRLVIFLLTVAHHVQAGPAPWVIPFNNTGGYGPDGPWHYISLEVGAPAQTIDFYPLLGAVSSLVQSTEACNSGAPCLSPRPRMYDTSLGTGARKDLGLDGSYVDVSNWEAFGAVGPGKVTGGGMWWMDQVDAPTQAQNVSMYVTTNISVQLASGPPYVPLSLFALEAKNQTQPKKNAVAPFDYEQSYLVNYVTDNPGASSIFGMHIGSPSFSQDASLLFGGYDQSRLIEYPAIFDTAVGISIKSISVGTSSGRSPFDASLDQGIGLPPSNLLKNSMNAKISPSTPYIQLPQSVCDAMTEFLPIEYRSDLNLYTWDINAPAYKNIVTSPTYLNFTLNDTASTSIRVPFALLNLTLDAPLVTKPIAYFPCFPEKSSSAPDTSAVLGRAFLQAAFFAQSFDENKIYIGQAPGPKSTGTNNVGLPINSAFVPISNAPEWEDSWASVLKPLGQNNATTGNTHGNSDSSNSDSRASQPVSDSSSAGPGISTAAIIAISVSLALATSLAVACILFLLYRRKRRELAGPSVSIMPVNHIWPAAERRSYTSSSSSFFDDDGVAAGKAKVAGLHEMADSNSFDSKLSELDGTPRPSEMDNGDGVAAGARSGGVSEALKVVSITPAIAADRPKLPSLHHSSSSVPIGRKGKSLSLFPAAATAIAGTRDALPQPQPQPPAAVSSEPVEIMDKHFSKRWTKFRSIHWTK